MRSSTHAEKYNESDGEGSVAREAGSTSENPQNLDTDVIVTKLRQLGLFIQDLEHHRVYPNALWSAWGYSEEDMVFGNFINFVHPEDREKVRRAVEDLNTTAEPYNSVLFRIKTAQGQWRWVYSTSLTVTRDAQGNLLQYIGFDYDLTEQMEARERAEHLAREAETLSSAAAIINSQLDLTHTIVAILEQAKLVLPFSSASVQLLKGDVLEIVGGKGFANPSEISGMTFPIPGDNPNSEVVRTREALMLGTEIRTRFPGFVAQTNPDITAWMGIPLISKDELIGILTFDRKQEPGFSTHEQKLAGSFGNHVAISLQNSRLYEDVKALSIRDPLTACYNRRQMYEIMEQQMELSIRHGQELSVILFDLDNFKDLNDNYGHLFGDRVLKTVTTLTREMLRMSDSLCRFGGEEFVIILPHGDESTAVEIAGRIRKTMEEHGWFPDSQKPVTLSLGCAAMQLSDLKNCDALISRADSALLRAKKAGKNRVVRYSSM